MGPYFTCGIEFTIKISVELIFCPGASMCHRKINQDHVEKILHSMVNNHGKEPQIADLIPLSRERGKLMDFGPGEDRLKVFKQGLAAGEIVFVAISGQHSAKATAKICEYAKTIPGYVPWKID